MSDGGHPSREPHAGRHPVRRGPGSTLGGRGGVSFPEPDRLAAVTSHVARSVSDGERVTSGNQEGLLRRGGLDGEGCRGGKTQGKEAAEKRSQTAGREGRGSAFTQGLLGLLGECPPAGPHPTRWSRRLGCRSGSPDPAAWVGSRFWRDCRSIRKRSWQSPRGRAGARPDPDGRPCSREKRVSLPLHVGLLKLLTALVD